jgi:hypothetical protein
MDGNDALLLRYGTPRRRVAASMSPPIARLLDALYPEPDPFDTAEAFERAHHGDIPELVLDEVDAERILARLRWAATVHHGGTPSRWLLERIARLDRVALKLRQPVTR